MNSESRIPGGFALSGRSPDFDQASLPAALLRDHRTRAGTYGMLRVLAGSLQFVASRDDGEVAESLQAGDHRLIHPGEPHRVVPGEGMQFFIEFYREVDACS